MLRSGSHFVGNAISAGSFFGENVLSTTPQTIFNDQSSFTGSTRSELPNPLEEATLLVTESPSYGATAAAPIPNAPHFSVPTQLTSDPLVTCGGSGRPPSRNTLIGVACLLAANSGFMNGLTLSGSLMGGNKQDVAAITGTWTASAISTSARSTQFIMIASYLAGSCLNAILNPNGVVDWAVSPNSLLVAAGLVLAAFVQSGNANVSNLSVWTLLTIANGCQNSWTSSLLSGNVLRTAHFSGITSDMGTFLGQALRGNNANVWKLRIYAQLAGCFWIGGALSVLAAKEVHRRAFLANVGVYVALWAYLSFFGTTNSPKVQERGKTLASY